MEEEVNFITVNGLHFEEWGQQPLHSEESCPHAVLLLYVQSVQVSSEVQRQTTAHL